MPTTTHYTRSRAKTRVTAGLLQAYPTLRRAAKMIGVSASSLSRRPLAVERAGREKRLAPSTVLELAAYYRKRDEYEVGGALVEYALEHAEEYAPQVEAEVDAYLRATGERDAPLDSDRFLAEARRSLPEDVYEQVERIYRAASASSSTPS